MSKKRKILLLVALIIALVSYFGYSQFLSPTRVATLNFPDFMVEKIIRSNNNPFVEVESVGLDEVERLSSFDLVLVRVHGVSMDSTHLAAIQKAIDKGVTVFSTESDNAKINSLKGRELKYFAALMDNSSVKNNQSLLNYTRKNLDKKLISNKSYGEPIIVPADFFFHLGDDNFFATYEEYQKFYIESGKYREGAPRIAMLQGNINLQNSNEEHIAAMINSLEDRGLNVYPINSFGMAKLPMLRKVNPNIIINNPHGRLVMGGAEAGEELLKSLNVPILAPVTVSELHDTWLKSRQGMEQGGLTSMSVVLPELDGAIAPFAVAAQVERNGYNIFDAIPNHTDKFTSLVKNFTELQTKSNADKKVAIYYYKGTGKGSVGAADLEGVQSLYNTLKHLKTSGYSVDGLPSSAKELEAMIQRQGSVLGAYALGAYDEFLKHGNPALIDEEEFYGWAYEAIPAERIEDIRKQYGDFAGDYMTHYEDGKEHIAVARIEFGNVAILPQPMAASGDNVEAITHGVEGAPAYPYIASYLWTRFGFKADAMIHFGTHGSLEFIPGKQLALSDYDFTDALVGDMPHFYIYTINNIGEGIIAKRRSYATLIDHLTAPFMQGELYGDLQKLKSRVHTFEHLEEGEVKQEYRKTITELAKAQNMCAALGIDSTKVFDDAAIERVHIYLEEIDGAKVTDGLYTLGEGYTAQDADNTLRMMMIDAVRYSLATIDVAKGKISAKELDNIKFISHNYTRRANRIIDRSLRGQSADKIFKSVAAAQDIELYTSAITAEKQKIDARNAMMRQMLAQMSETQKVEPFFNDKGELLGDDGEPVKLKSGGHPSWIPKGDGAKMPDSVKAMLDAQKGTNSTDKATHPADKAKESEPKRPSMMESMAQAKPQGESTKMSQNEELIGALKSLNTTIKMIAQKRSELTSSTQAEQAALINALNGGYILPSSAGDPIANPNAISTGRNFYSINPETTPTVEAWRVGKRLAENLLEQEMASSGKYPEKVSFTLWSSDFISSEGATIAQILWLLGVEPLRDGFGYIRSLRLVSAKELGRPRIDVVVQTSGQLRDIAASRLKLINDAVAMAAQAEDGEAINFVAKGFNDAEARLLERGFSPADARKYSRERIFGGAGGNYGTGIIGMVEDSESWSDKSQIAQRYIQNMGALYSSNGDESWGEMREGVFEAALLNTSVVVQPRSSNTWGPLSLDHVYEFMGGISAAVQEVTGNDPTAYFNDFRNTSRAKVQGLKEAIGVETSSTIFNPKYINEKLKGEASSYAGFAETIRNTFGWNAMKPSAIDEHIWNEYHEVYVRDKHSLGIVDKFSDKNPYAMQELTAVMMESARKGMWNASQQQLTEIAALHTEMVTEHEAACSGFVCDNAALREFIAQNAPQNAEEYREAITQAREVQLDKTQAEKSVVLKKEEQQNEQKSSSQPNSDTTDYTALYIIAGGFALLIGWVVYRKRRK